MILRETSLELRTSRRAENNGGAWRWTELAARRSRGIHAAVCSAVMIVAAVYLSSLMLRGWIPHDEGALAQSAHRILRGELPHRDFDEIYTGGLSFLHAGAFLVWGERLASLRFTLFSCELLAIPVYYYVASRYAPPMAAGVLTIGSLAWGFGNYPASMPSWYNLLLAICACACVLRYLETGARRWMMVAGFCCGLSVLVKIVGVYLIAAIVLFLVYHVATAAPGGLSAARRPSAVRTFIFASVVLLASGPLLLMRHGASTTQVVVLALPILGVGLSVGVVVWRTNPLHERGQWMPLVSLCLLFAAGVMIPLAAFAVPYAASDSLYALLRGVIVLPRKRLEWAANAGPPALALLLALPHLFLLLSARFTDQRLRLRDVAVISVFQAALVIWSASHLWTYELIWLSIEMLAPFVLILGAFLSAKLTLDQASPKRHALFLIVSVTAWSALVQFPFTAFTYFCYVAPLILLSIFTVVWTRGVVSPRLGGAFLLIYAMAGFLGRPVMFAAVLGRVIMKDRPTASLDLPRGGLVIRRDDRDIYAAVIDAVQRHSRSRYIYVTPDAPEVYFLAMRENPTRTVFDFLDDPTARDSIVLKALRDHDVEVVVINKYPEFSGMPPRLLYDSLKARFPEAVDLKRFEVRWRS